MGDNWLIQSETYPLLDALYLDGATSDQSSIYTKATDNSMTFNTNHYEVNIGNSYRYVELRADATLLNLLKGKTIKFRANIGTSNTVAIHIRVNNVLASNEPSTSTDAIIETDSVDVPNDATSVYFRLIGVLNSTFNLNELVVYTA